MLARWKGHKVGSSADFKQRRRHEVFVLCPFVAAPGVSNLLTVSQLRDSLRKWLTPPDPLTNHNIATDIHQGGTAAWFSQGGTFAEWKSSGSLLWIYGKRTLFSLFPDRPLTTVCVLSWLRQEHPLVHHRSAFPHAAMTLLYSLVLQSSKRLTLYVRQGQP